MRIPGTRYVVRKSRLDFLDGLQGYYIDFGALGNFDYEEFLRAEKELKKLGWELCPCDKAFNPWNKRGYTTHGRWLPPEGYFHIQNELPEGMHHGY